MWRFFIELSSGFIDGYSFQSLEDCIDSRESCLIDNSVIKVSNIFYDNNYNEED